MMITNLVNILKKPSELYTLNGQIFMLHELYLNKTVFKKSIRDHGRPVRVRHSQLWTQDLSIFQAATGPATPGYIPPQPSGAQILAFFIDDTKPTLLASLCQLFQTHVLSRTIRLFKFDMFLRCKSKTQGSKYLVFYVKTGKTSRLQGKNNVQIPKYRQGVQILSAIK